MHYGHIHFACTCRYHFGISFGPIVGHVSIGKGVQARPPTPCQIGQNSYVLNDGETQDNILSPQLQLTISLNEFEKQGVGLGGPTMKESVKKW